MQRREGVFLQAPTLPFHFWLSLLPFCFKCFLLASSSSQTKEKKRKTIEKKRNAEKGGSFPSSSCSTLSLLASASTLLFQMLSLGIFFVSSGRKGKKNHKEEKNCRERKELSFLLLLLHLGWNITLFFSSPHSFNNELSTFFNPCVSHLFKALCYSSLGALLSFGDGMSEKWSEGSRRGEVGRRGGE